MADDPEFYTPAEVTAMFGVHPKTLARWARAGRFTSVRTLGGQRRYHAAQFSAGLPDDAGFLTAPEVAALLGVCLATVISRADKGKLTCIRTVGGHRRFPVAQFSGTEAAA